MIRIKLLILVLLFAAAKVSAQQVDSIYFHLYTDSLKKGFYNYINVDGKLSNGQWLPLDSSQVRFQSNAGSFRGNDLFINSDYRGETVRVHAELKTNPAIWKEVIIYIRKRPFSERLRTSEEIMNTSSHRRN